MEYLPYIVSLITGIITVGVSLWLGIGKQKTEDRSAFQDDLFELLERYEKQLELKDKQIEFKDGLIDLRNKQLSDSQMIISQQLEKITELNISVRSLQNDVKELKAELDKFNKKVFYTKPIESES